MTSLQWTYSVRNRSGNRLIVALVAAVAVAFFAFILFHTILASVLSLIAILVSIAEAVLPLSYSLDIEKASVKLGWIDWLEMPWTDVTSIYRTVDGIKLSVFKSPKTARLEPFRGILLRLPEGSRETVERFLSEVIVLK